MHSRVVRNIMLVIGIVLATIPAFYCNNPQGQPNNTTDSTQQSAWRNVYDTNAHYVGMNTCKGCHEDVYKTFIQTGMGQSFDHATAQKSAADFSPQHALVYDKFSDYYYKPFFRNDTLYIMEFRTEGKDTVHKLIQRIDYVVGSGQHTNSHIFHTDGGFFYQAPITFYTQKHKWDMAPGFENGGNVRFSRIIQIECMSCHNGYPDPTDNIENKFTNVKTGIDCERCHGPGSIHVAEKQSGKIVDTSKMPDYSIVNPRRLSTELQNNLCQRCHLQGIAVINDGKTFFDFRPGMHLSEVMNVFMPEYEGAQDKMIMASHVERMKKSNCYLVSGAMSCITCHNPHVSVKFTPRSQYIDACQKCHNSSPGKVQCTERENVRAAKNNDCITCHMPRNGSIDIPHVAVTDHYIRKRQIADSSKRKISAFLGLKSFNNSNPDPITVARAYMEFFERYNPNKGLINSAIAYLNRQKEIESVQKQNKDFVRAYFLLGDFDQVIKYASALQVAACTDAWTAYRIGEAYTKMQQPQNAVSWYQRAVTISPDMLDFQNKYGACLITLKDNAAAEKVFQLVLKGNPNDATAYNNLGYICLQQGQSTLAYDYLSRSYELNPDNAQTLINLSVWYHANGGSNDKIKKLLTHLLQKHPDNEQAKAMLADLK